MEAHLSDLPRHGIEPKGSCDVCGGRGANEIDRQHVRESVARWVRFVCARCERRFAVEQVAA
jgi:hypothetical protein